MKILVTGATGFVGAHFCNHMAELGHNVKALVRSKRSAAKKLKNVGLIEWPAIRKEFEMDHTEFDCVINLMGENIAGKRWSEARKKALYDSRIDGTKKLFEYLEEVRFKTFIQASAIGIYGNTGDQKIDESADLSDDFLGYICKDWEQAAASHSDRFDRLCIFRFGIILGDGGALAKMLPAFKLGFGGRLGDGKQFMSWVHIDDVVALLEKAVVDKSMEGTFNITAPEPVSNAEFTKALGSALGRPTILPAPAGALKLAMGEMSQLLLEGQRVLPKKLLDQGYEFKFKSLDDALKDLV